MFEQFDALSELLKTSFLEYKIAGSVLLAILVVLIRELVIGLLRRLAKQKQLDPRSLASTLRNLTNFALAVTLIILWSDDIKQFAFSIAAFTVAIILATREYVQCLLGFIYISSVRAFSVGDWIEIDGKIGEVANRDWLKVYLLEVDSKTYSYTGKSVSIPNNRFITQPVLNLNYQRRYANHSFTIVIEPTHNLSGLKKKLHKRAMAYCEPFFEVAQRYSLLIEKRLEVIIDGPEPEVYFKTNELANVEIVFSIFCPTELAVDLEQKLIDDLFAILRGDSLPEIPREEQG